MASGLVNAATFQAPDAKKEEFRRYLERSGVIDALTKVLVGLYEEPDKPANALDFIKMTLGAPTGVDVEALKAENEQMRIKCDEMALKLEEANKKLEEAPKEEELVSSELSAKGGASRRAEGRLVPASGGATRLAAREWEASRQQDHGVVQVEGSIEAAAAVR
eukprot:CAMPEP_0206154960 /NCGR_PEP_ID=MMETSP1474-20131121/1799_1 /ASSEMBLY_ACC=CAM_ASM_001110 /TAXON_ID=97495 /ORGANISM="Imantonia sp., Strain RCC918" /LENGTH=162 /DNA_ID=CAMNT_0053553449 /DNA_START=15 /DNA_END=504 /DNA_ORIENTATION=-